MVFQCHHGVPASLPDSAHHEECPYVSMPPRRSCFDPGWSPRASRRPRFNATTAFLLPQYPNIPKETPIGFNATTAFLLRGGRRRAERSPPRFNATTAFLLPTNAETDLIRKRTFQCHHGVPASLCGPAPRAGSVRFQCHHGVPASGTAKPHGRAQSGFQCHHGVPASVDPHFRINRSDVFQCHHGVPASFSETRRNAENIYVSMPPRRSCFPHLAKKARGP